MPSNKKQRTISSIQCDRTFRSGTTLVELLVASAMMAVVMASVLPLIRCLSDTFDVTMSNLDVIQNGRTLMDHQYSNLARAKRITSVSLASETLGYIEFEDNAGDTFRYDVNPNGYVDFGPVGSLSKLAGPVNQLQFTCYPLNDFTTPIADANAVRLVKIQATFENGDDRAKDKTFSTSVCLRVCYDPKYRFDIDKGKTPALAQIDTSHYLCAYQGKDDDGWAVVLNVDNALWTQSQGIAHEFDWTKGMTPALAQIDTSHYLCAYTGESDDGFATVLTVDTDDLTVSDGTALEFDGASGKTPALAQISESQYLCAYEGGGEDGWATILTVDTDTWSLTNTSTIEFDTDKGKTPALSQIDASHYLCAYTGKDDDGWAVVLGTNALMGHWALDETSGMSSMDSSGNGHTGSLTNMSGSQWTTGTLGGALAFDGYNDYVNCGRGGNLDISNAITVMAWIKPYTSQSSYKRLVEKHFASSWYFGYSSRANGLSTWINGRQGAVTSSGILPVGTWSHVGFTYDKDSGGSDQVKIYLNGSVRATGGYSAAIGTDNHNLAIGSYKYARGYGFNGLIDDVRIYNRAFSADEMAQVVDGLRYGGFTEAKAGDEATSITVSTPAANEDDLLIAAVVTDDDTSSSLAPPEGEGWAEININDYSNDVTLGAWRKFTDASESSSHQFTWSGGRKAYAWMMRFTGQHPLNPINAYSTGGGFSSSPTSPSVTTTVNNCLILRLGGFDDNDITMDLPGLSGHAAITMDESSSVPVGWWTLDETFGRTAADSSSSGMNGTLRNMSGTEWTTGQIGGALAFDGYNDYVYVGNSSVFNMTDSITIVAWVKPDSVSTVMQNSLVDRGSSYWFFISTLGKLCFLRYNHDDPGWGFSIFATDVTVPTGTWSHVAVTYDTSAGNEVRLYINGLSKVGSFLNGPINSSNSALTFADRSRTHNFDGTIDDVRIYNGALSAAQITALAGGGSGGTSTSVSGGAGYVSQPAMGASGTSTFSLTAAEQARLLTLAVAPASQSQSGSEILSLSKGTAFEFDTGKGKSPALIQIDGTHYLCAYQGNGDDGYAAVLIVDTSDWTISRGTPFEFDTTKGETPALTQIDASHYLCAYEGDGEEGWATVLNVNTSTWEISQGNILPFDTDKGKTPALIRIDDDHHLCAYEGDEGAGTAEVIDPTTSGLEY